MFGPLLCNVGVHADRRTGTTEPKADAEGFRLVVQLLRCQRERCGRIKYRPVVMQGLRVVAS